MCNQVRELNTQDFARFSFRAYQLITQYWCLLSKTRRLLSGPEHSLIQEHRPLFCRQDSGLKHLGKTMQYDLTDTVSIINRSDNDSDFAGMMHQDRKR